MKKIYTLIAGMVLAGSVSAQTPKYLTDHTKGAFVGMSQTINPAMGALTWQNNGGYVSGNNEDGDKMIVQLFDGTTGVSGAGTINSVSVLFAHKYVAAGSTQKIKIGVWENNGGEVGNLIHTEEVALSDIDVTQAGLQLISEGTAVMGAYNKQVTFSNVNIPTSKAFWAGVVLPTGADSLVVYTTMPIGVSNPATMVQYNYDKATTHAGVVGSDDSFYAYQLMTQNGALKMANFIIPNITAASAVSVDELTTKHALVVYPNPASEVLNFKVTDAEIALVKIFSTDGKLVSSTNFSNVEAGSVNISSLTTGMYIYEVTSANGASSKATFIKK